MDFTKVKAALEKSPKKREIIIMGLTLEKTAGLYWEQLKEAVKDSHIVTQKIDNGSYTITLSNGNYIQLWGNNSKAEREKLRGKDTYMFIIDEMQSQQGLYYLLTDIIGPILKGTGGELVCLGTAPIYAGTMWEKILSDPAYSHSHATMEDNPTIPDYQHALEQVLIDNHWSYRQKLCLIFAFYESLGLVNFSHPNLPNRIASTYRFYVYAIPIGCLKD